MPDFGSGARKGLWVRIPLGQQFFYMTKLYRYTSELDELRKEFDIIPNKDFNEKYFSHEFLIGDPACIDFLNEKRIDNKNERKR